MLHVFTFFSSKSLLELEVDLHEPKEGHVGLSYLKIYFEFKLILCPSIKGWASEKAS